MKILKVKNKSVNDRRLLPVMSKRFHKNNYTHVQINGIVYETSGNANITWIDNPVRSSW